MLPSPFKWVKIPAGDHAGSRLSAFAIAQYPITNTQYAVFIEQGGYANRRWWTNAGWTQRQQNQWSEPRYWKNKWFNNPDQPVVAVSWYEAIAFCRWLGVASGQAISLPTEPQWRRAAQGNDGRVYPWGDHWDCQRCNNAVKPCRSRGTTPVQQYAGKGDSPFGVVDMAGNVWEWCLTDFDSGANEVEATAELRVVCGGAWDMQYIDFFRCNFRYGYYPHTWDGNTGFRIVRI